MGVLVDADEGSSLGLGDVVDEGSSGLMSLLLGVCSLICCAGSTFLSSALSITSSLVSSLVSSGL